MPDKGGEIAPFFYCFLPLTEYFYMFQSAYND